MGNRMGKAIKERPILFSPEMVRAILDGHKTQTRRVIKPQPLHGKPWKNWMIDPHEMDLPTAYCPHGIRSDHLWVREKHVIECPYPAEEKCGHPDHVYYWADESQVVRDSFTTPWRPSIFMPRWASRLTLEITSVVIKQLQQITKIDAWKEGVSCPDCKSHSQVCTCVWQFSVLWDSINTKRGYGWDVNPWVWVIEFQRA